MSDEHPAGRSATETDRPNRRDQLRKAIPLVIAAIVILFSVLNLDKVKVHWIVTTGRTPLIVVIVLSFLLGALADRIAVVRERRRNR